MSKFKESLLSCKADHKEPFEFCGQTVYVKELSSCEGDEWGRLMAKYPDSDKAAMLVVATVDDKGRRVFEEKDIVELNRVKANVIAPLYKVCLKVNGLDKSTNEKKENSPEVPPIDSGCT